MLCEIWIFVVKKQEVLNQLLSFIFEFNALIIFCVNYFFNKTIIIVNFASTFCKKRRKNFALNVSCDNCDFLCFFEIKMMKISNSTRKCSKSIDKIFEMFWNFQKTRCAKTNEKKNDCFFFVSIKTRMLCENEKVVVEKNENNDEYNDEYNCITFILSRWVQWV